MDVSESEEVETLETQFSRLTEELNKARAEIEDFKTIKEAYEKQTSEYNQLKEDFIRMTKNFPISAKIENKIENEYKTYDDLKSMDYNEAYDYLKSKIMEEINENKDR